MIDFFCDEFTKKKTLLHIPCFLENKSLKNEKTSPKKIAIIAHAMEACLRIDTFIFQTLPNLA
jgi:hypothetical protein